MDRIYTYIGQGILFGFTVMLAINVTLGLATIPVLNASGFMLALMLIAIGNLDRNSIALPSLISMLIWLYILAIGVTS